jgi:hypothetical protein
MAVPRQEQLGILARSRPLDPVLMRANLDHRPYIETMLMVRSFTITTNINEHGKVTQSPRGCWGEDRSCESSAADPTFAPLVDRHSCKASVPMSWSEMQKGFWTRKWRPSANT